MTDSVRFKDLIDAVNLTNPDADFAFLQDAYWFAEEFHQGQYRKSGEPYITHPLHVAILLAELGLDDRAIAAGLLHDVVEDTGCTTRGLVDHFGEEVAFLVEGVTKLDQLSCVSREERQLESYRKMFVAMAQDIRVIIIKLADRLHNMRTMEYQAPEKQARIARETLEIYAPIADRLGIIRLKWELEDLSLRYLEPDVYYDLVNRISMKRQEREAYIDEVINDISAELKKRKLYFEIGGRPKHFYSIYRKMKKKNKDLDEIYDLIAIRVLVNTVQDCYVVLGVVHSLWKPVPLRFKDYIAMPKPNMYQSLHTTVIGPRGERFEIQIRTFEMHQVAEYGVAAHWLYKESGGSNQSTDVNQLDWIKHLKELQDDADDSKEMLENIKLQLFSDAVFVFSPQGEVYELPQGSTPIDYAYRVHTEIGNQCVGAKVNNRIVPFDYQLKNGDSVEILRSKNSKGPSRNWLNIVKNPQAKNKIRQWLKKNKREENIERGEDLYKKSLKYLGLDEGIFGKTENINRISGKMGYNTADDVFCALGIGGISTNQVINRLREEFKDELKASREDGPSQASGTPNLQPQVPKTHVEESGKSFGGVAISGTADVSVRFANCCKPVPGDPIIGYITRGHGVTVHHADCPNILKLPEKERARLTPVKWQGYEDSLFKVELSVEAFDRPKITPEVMALINDANVHILSITSRVHNYMAVMDITLEVEDIHELQVVMDKISSIPDVFQVRRQFSRKGQ